MNGNHLVAAMASMLVLGCAPKAAPTAIQAIAAPPVPKVAPKVPTLAPAPVVALVEPYLVAVEMPRLAPPPSLRGNILPDLRNVPVLPTPPTQTVPIRPSLPPAVKTLPPAQTPPNRVTAVPPAVVKLFQDERARNVDDARRRLAAASARASQTAAEAKRQWGFVKDGFVAQKQAENADATAKDAGAEQADAQKTLDDAQARQRNARHDIEAALRAVAEAPSPFALAQLNVPLATYQPVPQTYRLAILGTSPVAITVQNGILGRRLEPERGEAGAWLVRCPDPSRLRVGVGARPATVVVHSLPPTDEKPKV